MRFLRTLIPMCIIAVLAVPPSASADTPSPATLSGPKTECGQPQTDANVVAIVELRTRVIADAQPGTAGTAKASVKLESWALPAGRYQMRLVENDCTSYPLGSGFIGKNGAVRDRGSYYLAYGLEFCQRNFRVEVVVKTKTGRFLYASTWQDVNVCT